MLWAIIVAFFVGGTLGMALVCLLTASREFDEDAESREEFITK
jgi:hypothetical protein